MQTICALLIFRTADLPAPVSSLSPWLDWKITPFAEVAVKLDAQTHRRFVKTHTPLDGIVIDPRATYIVVARHPLDMATSLYHQGDNLNRDRMRELLGQPAPTTPPKPRPGLREWLLSWIDSDASRTESMDGLRGVMWHLSDAWARRDEPNIMLVHYHDLAADLPGEMRRIAERLDLPVPSDDLVEAATFRRMKQQAVAAAPDTGGVLLDPAAFFRSGTSGDGARALTASEQEHYYRRAAEMAPADMLAWLHRARQRFDALG
jgi:aryl sulfotransferase